MADQPPEHPSPDHPPIARFRVELPLHGLLFKADGGPVLVLTSGPHRVDTAKVAAGLGVGALRRAQPYDELARTGASAPGSGAPLGHRCGGQRLTPVDDPVAPPHA